MKKIQDVSGFIFILCVFVLTIISILGVWKVLNDDVITKSAETIGLLAVVAVVIIAAGKFIDKGQMLDSPVNPVFSGIRHLTIATLIASATLLALTGVLAIWDVLKGDTLSKSLTTLSIVAFSSIVIVITCLERENRKVFSQDMSGWTILLVAILGWVLLRFIFW